MTTIEKYAKLKVCLEDVLEWLENNYKISGVAFDEQSIIDSIKEAMHE